MRRTGSKPRAGNRTSHNRGKAHYNWRGGMSMTHHGYMRYSAGPDRGKLVHRAMIEKLLGRPLRKDEEVHHMDFDRVHNCYCNFILMCPGRAWQRAQHVNQLTPRELDGRFKRMAETAVDVLDGETMPDWVIEDAGGEWEEGRE